MVRVPLVAALLLATLLPWAPPAAAGEDGTAAASTLRFHESWDDGMVNWTVTGGASVDCTTDGDCSLLVDPPCCDTYHFVRRAVDLPLVTGTTMSFTFRGSALHGDTDSYVALRLSDGAEVQFGITEWNNHEVTLASEHRGSHVAFAAWPTADAWYGVDITFDTDRDVVRAVLSSPTGVIGQSRELPIAAEADRIEQIQFVNVFWGGHPTRYHYDSLCVYEGAAPEGCRLQVRPPPTVTLRASPADGHPPLDVDFAITAAAGRPNVTLVNWSLDFGDGATTGGDGAPPSTLVHTYEAPGSYVARLRVAQSDGKHAEALARLRLASRAPVVENLTHTPEDPQAHPVSDPLRTDEVTISADVADPDGLAVSATICWDGSHPLFYGYSYCDDMSEASPGRFAYTMPRVCHEGTIWYSVTGVDANGDRATAYGEIRYSGAAAGNSLGCYTAGWTETIESLRP